jgi:hypothetical protein
VPIGTHHSKILPRSLRRASNLRIMIEFEVTAQVKPRPTTRVVQERVEVKNVDGGVRIEGILASIRP